MAVREQGVRMVVRDVTVVKTSDRPVCEQTKSSAESIHLAMPRLCSGGNRCVKLFMARGSELCVPTNYDSGSSAGENLTRKTASVSPGGTMVANNSMVPNITESSFGGENFF